MTIYTIGHSTRSLAEFIDILAVHNIQQLVDVRSVPRSRHTPQFNQESIGDNLAKHAIKYRHIAKLGGLRHTTKNSPNTGWHNLSFRGYADYMQTDDFMHGLRELLDFAQVAPTAIMCAEAVPWRCHRSMIGDALLIRGIKVVDIFDEKKTQTEELTSFAQVSDNVIIYPPEKA